MKIKILAVGKTNDFQIPIHNYLKRINRFAPCDLTEIPEVKNKYKDKESENILSKIHPKDKVCLLDERGALLSSVEFSIFVEKRMQETAHHLIFIIGGPYGFSEGLYKRADMKLSLSPMTLPHDLARLFFVEQLYRAFSILNHLPYHHA